MGIGVLLKNVCGFLVLLLLLGGSSVGQSNQLPFDFHQLNGIIFGAVSRHPDSSDLAVKILGSLNIFKFQEEVACGNYLAAGRGVISHASSYALCYVMFLSRSSIVTNALPCATVNSVPLASRRAIAPYGLMQSLWLVRFLPSRSIRGAMCPKISRLSNHLLFRPTQPKFRPGKLRTRKRCGNRTQGNFWR